MSKIIDFLVKIKVKLKYKSPCVFFQITISETTRLVNRKGKLKVNVLVEQNLSHSKKYNYTPQI